VREVKRGSMNQGSGGNRWGLNPLGNRNLKIGDAGIVFIRTSRTASLSLFGALFSHNSSSRRWRKGQ